MGDMKAFDIHYRQATRMIECRGGMGALDKSSGLYAVLAQFTDLSPNSFEHILPIEALEESIRCGDEFGRGCRPTSDILEGLPDGFRTLARTGAISAKTCKAIIRMGLQLDDPSIVERASIDEEPVATWSQSWPDFSNKSVCLLERLICLALVRYIANVSTRIRAGCCPYEDLALSLSNTIPSITVPEGRLERESLLWIWLVTVDSWSVGHQWRRRRYVLQDRGMELFEQMLGRFPETENWAADDFELLGKRYFWRDGMRKWLESALTSVRLPGVHSLRSDLASLHQDVQGQKDGSAAKPKEISCPPNFVLPPSRVSWQDRFVHKFVYPESYAFSGYDRYEDKHTCTIPAEHHDGIPLTVCRSTCG
jgi:hypothetical protein